MKPGKPSRNLNHKINFVTTEEDWLTLNRLLDKAILNGTVKPRTTFSEYIRQILKKYIDENSSA